MLNRYFSRSRFSVLVLAGTLIVTSNAQAGDKDKDKGDPTPVPVTYVSWEEFKGRCANPKQFHDQHAPEQIRLQCSVKVLDWLPTAPGTIPLEVRETIITALFSDKYNVIPVERSGSAPQKGGSCLRFKEVEKLYSVERPLSCAEILSADSKGKNAQDICYDAVKGKVNPKDVKIQDTGRTIDTCNGFNVGGGGPKDGKP